MTFILDHKTLRDPADLGDQQPALAVIKTPQGEAQIMVIKIDGQMVHYHGGKPVENFVTGWYALNERR